jgi:hypothetical protein
MRPIGGTRDISVLDWIDVDVIDMPLQIAFVADNVVVKAPLPEAALAPRCAACGERFVVGRDRLGEERLTETRFEKSSSVPEDRKRRSYTALTGSEFVARIR